MRIRLDQETDTAAIMPTLHRSRPIIHLNILWGNQISRKASDYYLPGHLGYRLPISVTRCAVKLSHERRFKVTRVNGVLMFIRMLGDGT